MARTEIRYAAKDRYMCKRGKLYEIKREIEQFLTMLELQEIMIPFFCPFRKLFVRKWILFIRNYLFEIEGEMVNLRELQLAIHRVISPKSTMWRTKNVEINVDYGGSGLFLLLEIESSESCELKKGRVLF